MKNVILLSLDALSYTRLKNHNYIPDRIPRLNYLFERGICCINSFSNGQPTQMSFPSIFSSTLPLDCNGYDRGVRNRKTTLTEVMQNNGFRTVGFSTANFTGRYYSYDRGFDELYELYSIRRFWNSTYKSFFSHFVDTYRKELMSFDEFCDTVSPFLIDAFEYLRWFARDKEREVKDKTIKYNSIVHGYDFSKLYNLASYELEYFRKNPKGYLSEWVEVAQRFISLINRAKYGEGFRGRLSSNLDQFLEKIMIKGQDKLGLSYSYSIKRYDHFVNAEYLKDCIIDWIDKNKHEPFFLWAHFLDIHEGNYTSGKFQIPSIFTPSLAKRLRMKRSESKQYQTERAINRALFYVDKQIDDIFEYLQSHALLDETLLVVTSDHGMAGGRSVRHGHKATLFYDEFIRIPLIFYNPKLEQRLINDLCSHLDLAPTIVDLMGVNRVNGFKGLPVYNDEIKKRQYVITENAGRGPCDFKRKKINIGLRTKRYKYIWKEDSDITQNELYNLYTDPRELVNINNHGFYQEVADDFNRIALRRCNEIRGKQINCRE